MRANKRLASAVAMVALMLAPFPALAAGMQPGPEAIKPGAEAAKPDEAKGNTRSLRLSECLNSDVYNAQNIKLGDVQDLVLEGGQNRIGYVVLSYGGVLGMGDKLFAVPWAAFEHHAVGPKRVILDIPADRLKNAPGFDKSKWPDTGDQMFRDQVEHFYDQARNTVDKMTHDDKEALGTGNTKVDKGLAWLRRISAVIGADVVSTSKDKVGDIYDVVADAPSGKLQYVVLSSGGMLGIGDKLYCIPMSAITTTADSKEFTVNFTKEQLKSAPSFDKNAWPDWSDGQYRSRVDNFFSDISGN